MPGLERPEQVRPPVRPPVRLGARVPINPQAVNWYSENAFCLPVEKDIMSKVYPWLFGKNGLYPTQYILSKKGEELMNCHWIGEVCVCEKM